MLTGLASLVGLAVSGCGGGGSGGSQGSVVGTHQAGIQAAQSTATSSAACQAIAQNAGASSPDNGFYWEVGDAGGVIASGTVTPPGGVNYTRDTALAIASASKWVYGAYVVELLGSVQNGVGVVPASDVQYLNFTSGYDNMSDTACSISDTVDTCLAQSNGAGQLNGDRTLGDIGKFYYNSGHLEHLASSVMGQGGDTVVDLSSALVDTFASSGVMINPLTLPGNGSPTSLFLLPIAAGGIYSNATNYAAFLQGMLRSSNPLRMRYFLQSTANDAYAVCANPSACPNTALQSPLPSTLNWHYSITHWIEDDPTTGDGAYSSPGKDGFYPWIDAGLTYYGIISRFDNNPGATASDAPYYKSAMCGAAIRKAFLSGVPQS